jgi:hypothetical protein
MSAAIVMDWPAPVPVPSSMLVIVTSKRLKNDHR